MKSWEMIKEILTDRELDDCILDIGKVIKTLLFKVNIFNFFQAHRSCIRTAVSACTCAFSKSLILQGYNCRIMILNGKILFIRPKQDLANGK
jgi:hypothetical protein